MKKENDERGVLNPASEYAVLLPRTNPCNTVTVIGTDERINKRELISPRNKS